MGGVILAFFGNVFYNTGKEVSIHFQRRKRRKMGKKDIALARYFEDPRRYADLINGYVFGGEQVVRAEDIVEKDTRATGVTRRGSRRSEMQKYRDIIRRVALGAEFVLIGLEHQDEVHYAMPVRVMIQDAAGYDGQLRRLRREKRGRKALEPGEFLGGFGKADRLYPVVTLVLYYGKEPWDGEKELYGLLDSDQYPEAMMRMVNNYHIHVLEMRSYEGTWQFRTDLHEVMGFIQRAGDKEKERSFTEENRENFEALDEEAYDVITALTGSEELEAVKEQYRERGGTINMCEAIRGMIEDGRQEGLLIGKQKGAMEKIQQVAYNMYCRGMSAEDAAAICEIEHSQIQEWFDGWDS